MQDGVGDELHAGTLHVDLCQLDRLLTLDHREFRVPPLCHEAATPLQLPRPPWRAAGVHVLHEPQDAQRHKLNPAAVDTAHLQPAHAAAHIGGVHVDDDGGLVLVLRAPARDDRVQEGKGAHRAERKRHARAIGTQHALAVAPVARLALHVARELAPRADAPHVGVQACEPRPLRLRLRPERLHLCLDLFESEVPLVAACSAR